MEQNIEEEIVDYGIKCFCGSSTKFYSKRRLFKCDRTGEWVIFYSKHPCIQQRNSEVSNSSQA